MATKTKEKTKAKPETVVDKAKDLLERAGIAAKWEKRIQKTGMNRTKFCEKYGLNHEQICRYAGGKVCPEWETVWTVEKALFKENV